MLKRRIFRRVPRPTTIPDMRQAIAEEWADISDDRVIAIVESMPERVQAVIAANGGHTRY
jgi:hypothetical protein